MLKHRWTDRVCCIVMAVTLLLTGCLMGAQSAGLIEENTAMGYENRLFDQSRVHTVEILMDDWEGFLAVCTDEEYRPCTVVIDGEAWADVGIRAKGNTSLSSVKQYGNNRYSFKIEFDQYTDGMTCHGLDKLSLNNIIQDYTYMKDYLAYTLMNRMGVAAPLCSFAWITVNGEPWGLYLAVEAVEDSFLRRNYGADAGELYKPDSMSLGGGRGNGRDFDMTAFADALNSGEVELPEGVEAEEIIGRMEGIDPTQTGGMMPPEGFDPTQADGMALPEGFDPMQTDGMMPPEGFDPTQTTEAEAEADAENTQPDAAQSDSVQPENVQSDAAQPDSVQPEATQPGVAQSDSTQQENAQPGAAKSDRGQPGRTRAEGAVKANRGQENGFSGRGRPEDMAAGDRGGRSSSDVCLKYTDDDPSSYANIFGNAKTDVSEADQARLIAALKVLGEGDTAAVDTDAVIRYLAVHNFVCNGDSYTGSMVHNYYLHEADGVLSMIPWDYNLAMGAFNMGGGGGSTAVVNSPIDSPVSDGDVSTRPMVAWIFDSAETLDRYHAVYSEFMETVFESGWFEAELARVSAMIAPYVENDPTAFCTYDQFTAAVESLSEFCALRAESIRGQLNGEIPSTKEGQSADSAALVDASHVNLNDMGEFNHGGRDGGEVGEFRRAAFPSDGG